MKPYFVLLAILWAVSVFTGIWGLSSAPHPVNLVKSLGDVVLFTLCLLGCLQLAWGKKVLNFTPAHWRITYNATFILGAFYVMIKNYGDMLGVPTFAGETSLLQVGLDFLPYLLFSIPVIVLEHELKKADAED